MSDFFGCTVIRSKHFLAPCPFFQRVSENVEMGDLVQNKIPFRFLGRSINDIFERCLINGILPIQKKISANKIPDACPLGGYLFKILLGLSEILAAKKGIIFYFFLANFIRICQFLFRWDTIFYGTILLVEVAILYIWYLRYYIGITKLNIGINFPLYT